MTTPVVKFKAHLTRKEVPALWESGGYEDGEGYSQIIAGADGEKLYPIYIERRVERNGNKALFAVHHNYFLVVASFIDREYSIQIYRITSVNKAKGRIEAKLAANFDDGEWDDPRYADWPMVVAAKKRANCNNCEELFFGKDVG